MWMEHEFINIQAHQIKDDFIYSFRRNPFGVKPNHIHNKSRNAFLKISKKKRKRIRSWNPLRSMWFLCFYGALHMFLGCLRKILFLLLHGTCAGGGCRLTAFLLSSLASLAHQQNIIHRRVAMWLFGVLGNSISRNIKNWISAVIRHESVINFNRIRIFWFSLCGFYECRLRHELLLLLLAVGRHARISISD